MAKLYDEQFANVADYDCFSQSVFESVDGLVAMKEDPFYKEFVKMDHENFADTRETKYVLTLEHCRFILLVSRCLDLPVYIDEGRLCGVHVDLSTLTDVQVTG